MASNTLNTFDGICPEPFLRQNDYPLTGGFVEERRCFPFPSFNATCCLPCPTTNWIYAEGFEQRSRIANWMNLAAACATAFLLLSFLVLDVKWTHRHYLSVCLAIGVFFMELAFILPLITQPEQCHNDITPNHMQSDLTCALSGAFLLFGGWAAVIWVFWRALSIHLQICWEVTPGPKFFYSALTFGWAIPAAGIAAVLPLTGVSYRFGNVCHINHKLGLSDFWGPLLGFASLSVILQFITIGYCLQVFVKSCFYDAKPYNTGTSDLPSIQSSFGGQSARKAYQRVKRLIQLQWRGAAIVLVILGQVIFFSIVFVKMDNATQLTPALEEKATDWVICLILTQGDKNKCQSKTSSFVLPEEIVLAVLICLALSGFWCLLFLGRWSMVLGWRDLFRRKMLRQEDFASADAYQISSPQSTFPAPHSTKLETDLKGLGPAHLELSPGSSIAKTPGSIHENATNVYFYNTHFMADDDWSTKHNPVHYSTWSNTRR